MIVWIIEDEAGDRERAKNAVKNAAQEKNVEITLASSLDVSWPPVFPGSIAIADNLPPAIVVLDLYGEAEDFVSGGRAVYQGLRKMNCATAIAPFIIVWTSHTIREDAEVFFSKIQSEPDPDRRLILCEMKDADLLEEKVAGCLSMMHGILRDKANHE